MTREEKNKKRSPKEFKFSEYHLLIISAVIFILQYSWFSANTINLPRWIYLILILAAIITNIIAKKSNIKLLLKISEFTRVFKTFIVYLFLSLGIGLLLFGITNKIYSNNRNVEILELKIVRVFEGSSKSSNRIYFILDGKEYGLSVPSSPEVSNLIKVKNSLEKTYLLIYCKRGLLGTYIIDDKYIMQK